MNSYEAKLKLQSCADDPLFNVKPENYEMDTDPCLEYEKAMVSETNNKINNKENNSRKIKKTHMNSNEAKHDSEEYTKDPLLNIKSEIFEVDIDTFIEPVKANIETYSNDIKNLENQSDKHEKNGKKLEFTGSFVCGSCTFIANTLESLKYHIQTLHCTTLQSAEPQTCTDCGKVLSSKRYLKSHIERVHGKDRSNVYSDSKWNWLINDLCMTISGQFFCHMFCKELRIERSYWTLSVVSEEVTCEHLESLW